MDSILTSVSAFSDELLLNKAAHPKDFITRVLQFNVEEDLDITPLSTLSKFVVVLGQYLITLNFQYGAVKVNHMLLNKDFRRQLKVVSNGVKGSSVEERESIAVLNSPILVELEHKVMEAQAKVILLEGAQSSITELMQAFKTEINRRFKEKEITSRE
jgi:hypothetical protein